MVLVRFCRVDRPEFVQGYLCLVVLGIATQDGLVDVCKFGIGRQFLVDGCKSLLQLCGGGISKVAELFFCLCERLALASDDFYLTGYFCEVFGQLGAVRVVLGHLVQVAFALVQCPLHIFERGACQVLQYVLELTHGFLCWGKVELVDGGCHFVEFFKLFLHLLRPSVFVALLV